MFKFGAETWVAVNNIGAAQKQIAVVTSALNTIIMQIRATKGLDDAWSVGGRAGFLVTPTTLVYALVAYQQTDVDDTGTGLVSSLSGFGGGGGIETEVSPGWLLRGEYRYVGYDDKMIGGLVNLATDEHQVRAGLVWRFWDGK